MFFLPLTDEEDGLTPGKVSPDEEVVAWLRAYLPDFYFVNAPISRMRRHCTLLQKLTTQTTTIDFHRPPGAGWTELTLCGYDQARPGLLSQVAGVLALLKINVHTAWIHTLSDPFQAPDDPAPRRVILDTLLLSEPYFRRTRVLTPKTQKALSSALAAVLNGQKPDVWATHTARPLHAPLEVLDLSATNLEKHTLIKLRASDDSGVLYRITAALAALELNVAHAQINTFERAVDDVFFVTQANGQLIPTNELSPTLERLREALAKTWTPGESLPLARG